MRTAATFYKKNPSGTNWVTDWTESYTYDANTDYLLTYTASDGIGNYSASFDAAGNRSWHTVDNLNRLTAVGSVSYTNDILGNRLTWNPGSGDRVHTWDSLNRMVSRFTSPKTTNFTYRADGMRTKKVTTWGSNSETFRYYYDGQMPMEDSYKLNSGALVVNRFGLGARGLDFMETGGNVAFPVYDGHGNMVATLARNGAGYTVANRRSFDPWGKVRTGATTGDPSGRYCANLGHKQDDDSGYIYMRARYYEPGTGRFISEDPAMEGPNWYSYCYNSPLKHVDASGRSVWSSVFFTLVGLVFFFFPENSPERKIAKVMVEASLFIPQSVEWIIAACRMNTADPRGAITACSLAAVGAGVMSVALLVFTYQLVLLFMLANIDVNDSYGTEWLLGRIDSFP